MRAINLLPKDAQRARRGTPDPALLIGVGGFAIVAAVLFQGYMSAANGVQAKKDERALLKAQLATLKPQPQTLPIQADLASTQPARIQAMSSVLLLRIPWDNVLGQIVAVLPKDISLTQLSASAPSSTATTATATAATAQPTGLQLSGWTASQDSVARLMERLMILPPLTDVTLQQSTVETAGGDQRIFRFTIVANVRLPGFARTQTQTTTTTTTSSSTTAGGSP
jgi:Tfp pilus assembly protein PilN